MTISFSLRRRPAGCITTQPILDYHTHASAAAIADEHRFRDLTEIWLERDHYQVGLRSQFVVITTDSRRSARFPGTSISAGFCAPDRRSGVERGELPNDNDMLGRLIAGVCDDDAAGFFRVPRPRAW
jgi:glucuronate isomerase